MNISLTDETLVREISRIADHTRQPPEQIITRALELWLRQSQEEPGPDGAGHSAECGTPGESQEEPLPDGPGHAAEYDEIPENPDIELFQSVIDYKEEAGQMSLEAITDKTLSIMRHITDNADTIMNRLKPGWDSGLVGVMTIVAQKTDAAESGTDLVDIANMVYDLILRVPLYPPDEIPPRHFRLEDPEPVNRGNNIGKQKAALQEVSVPCLKRVQEAWDNLPSIIPPHALIVSNETPWDMMGKFKDDPTWLEIEKERDRDWIWLGGEPE